MNLSGNCCRCVGILIMLIGITTGSSAAQAGSKGTSSASRGPSGDADAKKWSSPSSASGAKSGTLNPPTIPKPIAASATKASEQTVNVEKSGSAERKEDIGVIEKTGSTSVGDKTSEKEKSEKVEEMKEIIKKIINEINEQNKK
jgi:hypothetical protein